MQFNLDTYLSRIGLSSKPAVTETGLFELHNAQFYSIPFENLEIQLGNAIDINTSAIFKQIVLKKRGGYCFQLNQLMMHALATLGFAVRPILARVHLGDSPTGKTHQLIYLELHGKPWIVDAGFGAGGPRYPLPLVHEKITTHATASFRILKHSVWGWMLQTLMPDDAGKTTWQDSYSFDLTHVIQQDLALGNHFTSTAPEVMFTQNRIASIPTEFGRKSINNYQFTHWQNGVKNVAELPNSPGYLTTLKDEFGIEIQADYSQLKSVL